MKVPTVASLWGVGLEVVSGCLRLLLYGLWVWCFGSGVVMRLGLCRFWGVYITEGEYCFTCAFRVADWGQKSSSFMLTVLDGFTGSDVCVS